MQQFEYPLVSVVISCYNHEEFVKESIQSVIKQTYKNIELIIIDDGSKDNSVKAIQEMVKSCEERFSRFEFRSRPNIGLSATLNEALEWSKGDYWTTCSSDDFYHKDKIHEQVIFFLENESYCFCITKSFVVDDKDKEIVNETKVYNLNIRNNITFSNIFLFEVHLPVTGMYDKDFLKYKLLGFDDYLSAEDYDINLRIASQNDIGVIDRKLYYYRSPRAVGNSRIRIPMRIDVSESHLKTIKKYKNHPEYKKAIIEWNFRRFIYYSSYSHTKLYSFKGMIKSYKKANNVYYLKALFRLIFYWQKI